MSKEGVVLTITNLVTNYKAQTEIVFHGQVPVSSYRGDLNEQDTEALQTAADQAKVWMSGYDLAGPNGGTTLMDAAFGMFGDLVRGYIEAEYPKK